MIIFGTYVLHRTLARGTFECPHCQGVADCQIRRGRRWFHIMFIPLIPLGAQPEHVRCLRCKALWNLAVLGADGDQFRRVPPVQPTTAMPPAPVPTAPIPAPVEDSAAWAARNGLDQR